MYIAPVLFYGIIVLIFGFDPAKFETDEDSGAVSLSVSLLDGELGAFTVTLTAATEDNNTMATAIGIINHFKFVQP